MTIADLLAACLAKNVVQIQFLNECLLGAVAVKAKRHLTAPTTPAYTRVTFATTGITPGEAWRSTGRYVGVIAWIPIEDYKALENL